MKWQSSHTRCICQVEITEMLKAAHSEKKQPLSHAQRKNSLCLTYAGAKTALIWRRVTSVSPRAAFVFIFLQKLLNSWASQPKYVHISRQQRSSAASNVRVNNTGASTTFSFITHFGLFLIGFWVCFALHRPGKSGIHFLQLQAC